MARPPRVSPDRILAAAAAEFAARGFAGARVDRIARTAHVNKAMLYYHFRSKKTLYRTVLRQMFARAADRLAQVAAADLPPADKLTALIAAIGDHVREHPHLPQMMLREIVEGGGRLDRETLAALVALPRIVAGVVGDGIAHRAFRDVSPIFAYLTILAPLVVFFSGQPVIRGVADLGLMETGETAPDLFIKHLQDTMRRALAPERP